MRKIGNLVITLVNKKGEDTKIRTKQIVEARKILGHWKELAVVKVPEQFPVSLETAIGTSDSLFTADVTRSEAQMLYQGVLR